MNSFKKKISIMLGCLLFLTFLPTEIKVEAAYSEKPDPVEEDAGSVNKYISVGNEKEQLYNIILEIEGKNLAEYPPTDIIVVVDHSNSMIGSRFEKVKDSLTILGDKLLTDTTNINLGYVGFSDDVTPNLVLNLTDDKTVFSVFVEGQAIAGGGTNLHAGLVKAKELLSAAPADHQKVIIILSDGHTTYSYKATSVAPLIADEVKAYGSEVPEYKVTGYDYGTRIGNGGLYGLQQQTYKIDEMIIKNTGDPTIGELLSFKEASNHKVFSVGIELSDSNPTDPEAYSYTNNLTSGSQGVTHSVTASWSETNMDGLYNPDELIHVEGFYKNETSEVVYFSLENNLVADSDTRPIPGKANDFIVNTGEVIGKIYHNDVLVEELNLDQLIDRANQPFPTLIALNPGDTYKMEVDFTIKDFTLMGLGVDALNTLHIAQFRVNTKINSSSSSATAFAFNRNEYKGPLLGFHSAYKTKEQGEYVLKNLSSDGVEGSTYFDVNNVDGLATILADDIYTIITDSIVDGVVTDPMGLQVEFVDGAFSGADYKIWGQKNGLDNTEILKGITVDYNQSIKTLSVNGLNLSANEKIFIEYQVSLNTDDVNFSADTWYETNGRTTLLPRVGEELIDFPIPQVSVQPKTVTLQYFSNCGGDQTTANVPVGIFTYQIGDTVNVHELTPTRNDYQFTHWEGKQTNLYAKSVVGQKVLPSETFVINENTELHAQWVKKDSEIPQKKPGGSLIVEVIPPGTGVENSGTIWLILLFGSAVNLFYLLKKKRANLN